MISRITRRKFIKDLLKKGTTFAFASRAASLFSGKMRRVARADNITPDNLREAMFYKQLDGVMIQCMLEPRQCIVNNWERGYCGAKENRDGKYYTLVYSCLLYTSPSPRD